MTDTSLDATCLKCHGNLPTLWRRDIPFGMPLRGKLFIRVLQVPDLQGRESCAGWEHYLVFRLGDMRVRTSNFSSVKEIRKDVFSLALDGKTHYLKITAHTWTWIPCLANLLNGNMEIPIHSVLVDQGLETQMYYKHRFHRLLDGSLKMMMWIEESNDKIALDVKKETGNSKEAPLHPLEAWHRGAYEPVLEAWLNGRVLWVNSYLWDLGIFICNQHLLLGIFLSHHWNPLTHRSRVIIYLVSLIMNIFALGVTLAVESACKIPKCATNQYSLHCYSQSSAGYNKCNGHNGTYYCDSSIQPECIETTTVEKYQLVALAALVAYALTKFLIFFAKCKCAKWIPRESENQKCRKCLEEGGHFMMFVGVAASVLFLVLGILLTIQADSTGSGIDAGTWIWGYIVQVVQSHLYDLGFCILVFTIKYGCEDFHELKYVEDDEYFAQNPQLEGIEIRTKQTKAQKRAAKKKSILTSPVSPASRNEEDIMGEKSIGEKSPNSVKSTDTVQKKGEDIKKLPSPAFGDIKHKTSRFLNKLAEVTDENTENTAAKPKINNLKVDSKIAKKMKVKVPANAKPQGLLKVKTPEGHSVLIRLPANVQPGVSEMIIEYAAHKRTQKKKTLNV